MQLIVTKFPDICTNCCETIPAGTHVKWYKETKEVKHIFCKKVDPIDLEVDW